jgi:hypothetical protein
MDSEKLIEKTLQSKVQILGGWALKFHCISVSGFPDRIVLMPSAKIYFVELKSEGKSLGKLQKIWQRRLRYLGFYCERLDTMEKLYNFLTFIEVPC